MFTQSGAIKVDGVEHAIRDTGLSINQMGVGGEKTRTLVPMRDRVVRLEKLGQGATGSVYKALDLQTLQLVALKVIPIFDRAKRRQMVHELIALYKSLGVSDQPSPTSIKSNSAYQLVMTDSTDSGAGAGAGVGEGKYGEEEKKEGEAGAAGFVTRALAEAVAGGATTGGPGSSGGGGGDSVRGNAVVVEEEDETGRDNVVPFLDAFR